MKTRFAFAGFRHAHIFDLFSAVNRRPDCEISALVEESAAGRDFLAARGLQPTHSDLDTMLRGVECDVVAIGDCYGRRGRLAIAALSAGRHLLSDKPLCTSLAELDEIEKLAAEKNLQVGLQLDSRDRAPLRTLRTLLLSGELGEIGTIHIDGQHPLLPGIRPDWYFEPGMHGGTINDIGVHAFDFVPWLTGVRWKRIVSTRSWNYKARATPHFHDCAQLMATLQNGAGVLADFSYLAPDKLGYTLPHYWRLTIHGTRGMAETSLLSQSVTWIADDSDAPESRPLLGARPDGYLDDFLAQLHCRATPETLTTADCLRCSRLALTAQQSATET